MMSELKSHLYFVEKKPTKNNYQKLEDSLNSCLVCEICPNTVMPNKICEIKFHGFIFYDTSMHHHAKCNDDVII